MFEADEIALTYSHQDRMIAGGAMPVKGELKLGSTKELGTEYFLERREMGIINVGGKGTVVLDGKETPAQSMLNFTTTPIVDARLTLNLGDVTFKPGDRLLRESKRAERRQRRAGL